MLQRLLLLPLLSPLLAVLLVAAVNPRPWVALRLLTFTSAALPLGAWIAVAAGVGAALSSSATALALQAEKAVIEPRRQVRRRPWAEENESDSGPEPAEAPAWAGPARAAGEPAPTVSVPFRVIRRGSAAGSTAAASPSAATAAPPANNPDDWNDNSAEDW